MKSRGSDAPVLASSLRSTRAQVTGANEPVPGKSAYKSSKPSRREGRAYLARPVVTAASFLLRWRATGAASARPSLRPLFEEGEMSSKARAQRRRENEALCPRQPLIKFSVVGCAKRSVRTGGNGGARCDMER